MFTIRLVAVLSLMSAALPLHASPVTYEMITDVSQIGGSAFGNAGLISTWGGGYHLKLSPDSPINANVVVASNIQGGGDTINGNLDTTVVVDGLDTVTVTGTTMHYSLLAQNAIEDTIGLLRSYGDLTNLPTIQGNTLNLAATSGQSFNGNSNENVFAEPTTWNGALAITGSASQYVIIDVGQGSNADFSLGAITLSGGITSDHVLLVVDTTGKLTSTNAHGLAVNADIIDQTGEVSVDNFTLNGRLACSVEYSDCTIGPGVSLNSTVAAASVTAPEPSSLLLIGSGLLFLAMARRRFGIA